MPYWDERVAEMAKEYPDVKVEKYHIDILCAHFVQRPHTFDVVVVSNLFGDILSDLGPACTGTIGIAPSGNINPERVHPSVFEPVHGSAPDIAGQGIAICSDVLTARELAVGTLVKAYDLALPGYAYHLAHRVDTRRLREIESFAAWLRSVA